MEQHWYEGMVYVTIAHSFKGHLVEKKVACRTIEELYEHRDCIIEGLIKEIRRCEKEILRKQLTENVTPVGNR